MIDSAISPPVLAPEAYRSDRDMPRTGWIAEAHPIPGAPGLPGKPGTLTLSAAVTRALNYNPSLKAAFVEIEARHGEEAQAAVKPNPELLATVENFGGTKDRAGFKSAEETLEISQLIELGDKRLARLTLAHQEAAVAGWDYEAARTQLVTNAAQAFVMVLASQKRLEVLQKSVTVAEKTTSGVSARVDAGKVSPIELDRVKVGTARAVASVKAEQAKLEAAKLKLAALWGVNGKDFTLAQGRLASKTTVPTATRLKSFLNNNPSVARWSDEIGKRTAQLNLERSKAVPDIKVGAGVRRYDDTDASAFVASVSMPLQIFDRNTGNIQAAERRIVKAEYDASSARSDVASTLFEALGVLSVAATQVRSLERDVIPAAERAFDATQIGYAEGKLDLLNVLDTQKSVFEARLDLVNAQAEYERAKVQIEALIGRTLDKI
ncbi:MAG: TolC family protein [Hyphomicrobiaceae bacterium]|nr:TolC family protein [Hyphomicrobiaceae bacterium]